MNLFDRKRSDPGSLRMGGVDPPIDAPRTASSYAPKMPKGANIDIDKEAEYLQVLKAIQREEHPPTDFAPLSHPERMNAVGRITGNAIREAMEQTCKALLMSTDELFNATIAMQTEVEQFIKDLHVLGEEKAKAIEDHTEKLRSFLDAMQKERTRFFGGPTTPIEPQPQPQPQPVVEARPELLPNDDNFSAPTVEEVVSKPEGS